MTDKSEQEEITDHYVIRLRALLIHTARRSMRADISQPDVFMMLTDGLFGELLSASDALRLNEAAFLMMCRQAWQAWKQRCTDDETLH